MIKLRDYEKNWLWKILGVLNGPGFTLGMLYDGETDEDFGEMQTSLIAEIIRERLERELNG